MKNKKKTRRNPTIKQLRIGQKVWVKLGTLWQKLPIIKLCDPDDFPHARPVYVKTTLNHGYGLYLKDVFLTAPEPAEINWDPSIMCGIDIRKISSLLHHIERGHTLMYLGKSRTKKSACQNNYETDVGSYVKWINGPQKGLFEEEGRFLLVPVEGRYCISEKELKRRLFSKDDSGKWYIVYKEL